MPRKKKIHELAHNEWYDGAGDLQTEKWYGVTINTDHSKQDLSSYSSAMGTREQAEKLLVDVAQGWGRDHRLAIVQVFEPEVVEYKAMVNWPDREDPGPCHCGRVDCSDPPGGPPGCRCQDEGNDEGCNHCKAEGKKS